MRAMKEHDVAFRIANSVQYSGGWLLIVIGFNRVIISRKRKQDAIEVLNSQYGRFHMRSSMTKSCQSIFVLVSLIVVRRRRLTVTAGRTVAWQGGQWCAAHQNRFVSIVLDCGSVIRPYYRLMTCRLLCCYNSRSASRSLGRIWSRPMCNLPLYGGRVYANER